MSCAEITPKLELMADDELTSEQAANVLSHIDDCPACRDQWYSILNLRQAIKDKAASFTPSKGFEDKIITSIRKEAWQAKSSAKGKTTNPWLKYAAAGIAVFAMATYLYSSSTAPQRNAASVKTVIGGTQPGQSAAGAVSLEEAMSNFKQYVQKENSATQVSPVVNEIAALSQRAGFPVKPMQLNGFQLTEVSIISAAPGKAEMVRLCYKRTNGNEHDSVICYQAAPGKLIARGLAEHLIDGKKICCGEVEDKSVVFLPGQKGNTNEVLLVGTVSKSDLMDLVLSSS